jgi:ABC-type polysaccharide/polyol phosphate export permease
MSRRIITTELQASKNSIKIDGYFDKLLKYIPTEIVGGWVALTGLIKGSSDIPATPLLWGFFIFFIGLTALYIFQQTSEPNKSPALTQIVVSMGAFTIWVFALGEPFASLSFYRPVYGSIALILYTLVIPLINPTEDKKTV